MKTKIIFVAFVLAILAGYSMLQSTPAAAQSHADICQANYDQCIQGCGGATSCANQCQVNKDGCNSQGQ